MLSVVLGFSLASLETDDTGAVPLLLPQLMSTVKTGTIDYCC